MKKIRVNKWIAKTTNRQQGTDSKAVELKGNCVRKLSFIVSSRSTYWRAGFKLCSPNTSDLPLQSPGSLLFHIGAKENKDNINITVYINGEQKRNEPLQFAKNSKIKISLWRLRQKKREKQDIG